MLAWSWESQFRLSVTQVLCDKTKEHTADILIPHEVVITSFLTQEGVGGRHLSPKICAQSNAPLLKNANFESWSILWCNNDGLKHSGLTRHFTAY